MVNLSIQNCIRIGTFQKPRGISGTLQLNFEAEWEWSVVNTDVLLTETDGLLLPWFVADDGIRITSSGIALVDLDWIEDEISAKKLCGCPVYLEKSKILQTHGEIDVSEWIGFEISDGSGNCIGVITGEKNYSGNLVFSVRTEKGERLIPFHPDLMNAVDKKLKKLTMDVPEGLLDL